MESRVIGRYRQSNGAVVRCDVGERKEAPQRRGDDSGRAAMPKSQVSEREEHKEAAREASFMLTL